MMDMALRVEGNVRRFRTALNTRWTWVATGLVIAGSLLLAATACGGDSGGNDKTGAAASTTPAGGAPAAGQISEEVSKELKDLGQVWVDTSVKAAYDITSKSGTETTTSRLVLYWAPSKVRADLTGDVFGTSGQTTVISSPDGTYGCSQEGGGQCVAYPPSDNVSDILPFMSLLDPAAVEAGLSGLTDNLQVDSSKETVAGTDATCVSAQGDVGVFKWCFASNGLCLYQSSADAAGTSEVVLQATEIGTVLDSDFEPPYPVTVATEVPQSPAPTATPGG